MKCQKVQFKDGINYCIWKPFKTDDDDDEGAGLCFDISEEDIDETITLLQEYKKKEPEIYKPDPKDEEFERKWKEKTSTWYYKFWDTWLRNLSITINFFDWNFTRFFVSRRVPGLGKGNNKEYAYAMCSGISIGPLILTWK